MFPLRILIFSILLALSHQALSFPHPHNLLRENLLLKSEYQLAKSYPFYLSLNLVESRIQLKSKGLLLKEFPIKTLKIMGTPVPTKPLPIKKKVSFFKPKEIKIKPQKNVEDVSSDIPALGVEDMPSRYRLDLNEGVHLYIRPIYPHRILNALNLLSSLKTYGVTLPMRTLWGILRNKTYTQIDLYLTSEDAKALYWVAREGIPCLIFSP
jgi:hypothetical protein